MSHTKRDDSEETGSHFELNMGGGGLVKIEVDIFRATKGKKDLEEILLEVSGQRATDSKFDNIIVALSVGDAITVANAIQFATQRVLRDRATRAEEAGQ